MWHEKAARWLHFSRLPRRISSKWKWWRVPSWETTIFIIIIIISAPWRNVKDLAAWTISHQGQHIPLNGNGEKLFNWTPPRLKTCWPRGRSPLKDNHHSHHHRHHQCHNRHRHFHHHHHHHRHRHHHYCQNIVKPQVENFLATREESVERQRRLAAKTAMLRKTIRSLCNDGSIIISWWPWYKTCQYSLAEVCCLW